MADLHWGIEISRVVSRDLMGDFLLDRRYYENDFWFDDDTKYGLDLVKILD